MPLNRWLAALFIQQLFIHVIATGTGSGSEPLAPTSTSMHSLPSCDPSITWWGAGHCAPSGGLVTFGQTSFGSESVASEAATGATSEIQPTSSISNSTNATMSSESTAVSVTKTSPESAATSDHGTTHSEPTQEKTSCSTTSLTASTTMSAGSILSDSSDGLRLNSRFSGLFHRVYDGKALLRRLVEGWAFGQRGHGGDSGQGSCAISDSDAACESSKIKGEAHDIHGRFAREDSTAISGPSAPLRPSRNITSSKTVTQTFIVSPVPPSQSENSTSTSLEGSSATAAATDGTSDDEVKSCTRAFIEGRAASVTIPSSCFAYEPLSSDGLAGKGSTATSATSQEAQSLPLTTPSTEDSQSSIPAKGISTLSGINATSSSPSSSPPTHFVTLLTTATTTANPTPATITQSRRGDNNRVQAAGCAMPSGVIDGQGLQSTDGECSARRTVTVTKRICPAQGFI